MKLATTARVLVANIRSWLASTRLDEEFDREIVTHFELLVEDTVRRGVPPEEARRIARMTLGGLTQLKERHREWRGLPRLDSLLQDLRYGAHAMCRAPGFTTVVVLTLALGIGAATAIFSVVYAVLLRPLPYADPAHLAMLWTDDPKHDVREEGVSYPNFTDWRALSRSFDDMAMVSRHTSATLTGDWPEHVEAAVVTANLFDVLGVGPELGRVFSRDDEERATHAIVLSHGLWQRRFGGSPAVIGQRLEIEGDAWDVIGVMPGTFAYPSADIQFWQQITSTRPWRGLSHERYGDWGRVVGRLKRGVALADAQREMTAIGQRLERAYPPSGPGAADFAGFGVNVVPLAMQVTGRTLPLALMVLFGAVLFVLLIACANVANLLVARGIARQREIEVRQALGAGRARILRQLITESLLFAGVAAAVGVALAGLGTRALVALAPPNLPRIEEARIDPAALVFAIAVSAIAAFVFGLAPAWRLSRGSHGGFTSRLATAPPRVARARHSLVVVEIALSAVLLCSAGLLIRSYLRLEAVDPGFEAERVLTMRVDAPGDATAVLAFYRDVIARVTALPGVTAAGAIEDVLQRRNPDYGLSIPGRTAQPAEPVSGDAVSVECFKALGVRLIEGRLFSDRDRGRHAVVVNETMARHMWPGEDPIGKRFRDAGASPTDPGYEIVGVVADMRRQELERAPIAQIFWPHVDRTLAVMDLVVRTTGDPTRLAASVRREIQAVDKQAPVFNITTLDARLDASLSPRRFESWLLGVLAAVALAFAAIGIYGLMHYSVAQRTREIGIRMALGAQPRAVLGTILLEGGGLAAIGLMLGVAVALASTRLFAALLFGVSPTDPLTFGAVAALMGMLALVACAVPARRAARIDPLIALRED